MATMVIQLPHRSGIYLDLTELNLPERFYKQLCYLRNYKGEVLSCSSDSCSVTLRGPPWILKGGGVEISGRRLISLNSKTKRIAFLSPYLCWLFLICFPL